MPQPRYALYYVPGADDPLLSAGNHWLGRDPETGATLPQPPGLATLTEAPRRYGFHATLRPPFALGDGQTLAQFHAACACILAAHRPFPLPPLAVGQLDGFLALLPTAPCPPLHAVADALVLGLNRFRPPLSPAARARRRPETLSPQQTENLDRFGYPDMLATWRFHLTLSHRLPTPAPHWLRQAETHFALSLAQPRQLTDIALFAEPARGANFTQLARIPLIS